MQDVTELENKVKQQEEALSNAKQELMKVRALKQKMNKAFEMFEAIKEELNGTNIESEIDAL